MDGWIDGWMDGWINEFAPRFYKDPHSKGFKIRQTEQSEVRMFTWSCQLDVAF